LIFPVFSYNKVALDYLKTHKKVRSTKPEDLDFSYADLSEIDLPNVILHRANLTGTDFSKSNLSGADLSEAIGVNANFSEANLCGSNLTRFKGSKCNMVNVNLSTANLSYSSFSGDLSKANFDDAILYKAEFLSAVIFGASFKKADLAYVNFYLSDIRNVDFSYSNLTQATFVARRLFNVVFNKRDINSMRSRSSKTRFNKDDWQSINFYMADIAGARIQACLLTKTELCMMGAINTRNVRI
jgi:uncharacterized protein YjbI with pentapeptide repeats